MRVTTTATTTAAFVSDDLRIRAQVTPDDPCWVVGEQTWTWEEAWQDVQCLAGALVDAGRAPW